MNTTFYLQTDIMDMCPSPLALAQQLTHIELVRTKLMCNFGLPQYCKHCCLSTMFGLLYTFWVFFSSDNQERLSMIGPEEFVQAFTKERLQSDVSQS